MQQYQDLMRKILLDGYTKENRTGVNTVGLTGQMFQHDLRDGFPLLTTKRMPMNVIAAELVGFINAFDSAKQFRDLGCKIWDQNANENIDWLRNSARKGLDDLGRIYGAQWRTWSSAHGYVDQLKNLLMDIKTNPTSRRLIVNAWNAAELHTMALPPCHMLFQVHCNETLRTMGMTVYQRSCDVFLGLPFNIASYALLLTLIAKLTGYQTAELTIFIGDAHIYTNHLEQCSTQLLRPPMPLPKIDVVVDKILPSIDALEAFRSPDVTLIGYDPYPAISAPMAV